MKRSLKKGLAVMLSAAMLASSGGVSGLTSLAGLIDRGDVDDTFYLVELDAGEGGEFKTPYEYALAKDSGNVGIATSSNATATPSNATKWELVEVGEPGPKTVFAVDSSTLTYDDINSAEGKGKFGTKYIDGDVELYWLTEKGNFESAITKGKGITLKLSGPDDTTVLYAGYLIKAKVDEETGLTSDSIKSYGESNIVLKVNPLKGDSRLENVADLEETVKLAGIEDAEGLDFDSLLQLNIKPKDEENYDGSDVTIQLTLPKKLSDALEQGKEAFVLHKEKGTTWKSVGIDKVFNEGGSKVIEFTLNNFSPVVIGVKDAAAVNVTLENVPGGAGLVYANYTEEGRLFVPIGEKVPVPSGTKLILSYRQLNAVCKGFSIKEENSEEPIIKKGNESYVVPADKGDIVITPLFEKPKSDDSDDVEEDDFWIHLEPDETDKTTGYTGQLSLYSYSDNEKVLPATNWKLEDSNYNDNDSFTLDKNGKLSSTKELALGGHVVSVSCEYNNKTIRDDYVYIFVGSQVEYELYLGEGRVGQNSRIFSYWIVNSDPYLGKKDFNKVCEETRFPEKFGFFGDFEFDKWYRIRRGDWTEVKGDVEGRTMVYAGFVNKNTGEPYSPVIERLDTTDTPIDKPTVRPTTGSSSSGSSGGSVNLDVLVGSWKKDDNGWWYQLRDGSYAKDRWGIIGGSWYYFGSDGYMKTGWLYWNEGWYYLTAADGNDIGKMKTGWFYDEALGNWFYLNNSDGKMETGWKQIGSIWYYFNPNSDGRKGAMESNKWIGNYFLGTTGAWDKDMVQ